MTIINRICILSVVLLSATPAKANVLTDWWNSWGSQKTQMTPQVPPTSQGNTVPQPAPVLQPQTSKSCIDSSFRQMYGADCDIQQSQPQPPKPVIAPSGPVKLNSDLNNIVGIDGKPVPKKPVPCFGVEDCKNTSGYVAPQPKPNSKPATVPDGVNLNKSLTDPNSIVGMKPITQPKPVSPPIQFHPQTDTTGFYDPAELALKEAAMPSAPPQYHPQPQPQPQQQGGRGSPQCQQALSSIVNGTGFTTDTNLGNWYNANCL